MDTDIRTLVADDQPVMRKTVVRALQGRGFEICAECGDAPSAVEAALRERPEVCVLDIHMPGDGIAAAAEIVEQLPDTAVVMLTISDEDDDILRALEAGARGYLLKDTDRERLPLALKGVLEGEAAIPRALVARVLQRVREVGQERGIPSLPHRRAQLTGRELEIFDQLNEGLTTAQVALELGISQVTVRRHIQSGLQKLGVGDRESALRLLRDET